MERIEFLYNKNGNVSKQASCLHWLWLGRPSELFILTAAVFYRKQLRNHSNRLALLIENQKVVESKMIKERLDSMKTTCGPQKIHSVSL